LAEDSYGNCEARSNPPDYKTLHSMRFFLCILLISKIICTFAPNFYITDMATITLDYDVHNAIANKALDLILSLGVFRTKIQE